MAVGSSPVVLGRPIVALNEKNVMWNALQDTK